MNGSSPSMQATATGEASSGALSTILRDEPNSTDTGNRWNGMTLPQAPDSSQITRTRFNKYKHPIGYGILSTGVAVLSTIVALQAKGVIPSSREASTASALAECRSDNATMADNWQQAERDNSTMADMLEGALGTISDQQEVIASLNRSSTVDSCTPTATPTVANSVQRRDEIYVTPTAEGSSTTSKN